MRPTFPCKSAWLYYGVNVANMISKSVQHAGANNLRHSSYERVNLLDERNQLDGAQLAAWKDELIGRAIVRKILHDYRRSRR